tara:strand:- start:369 stop:599 length:231 start_codon:yes stop_codon:yes gene_type:complete
MNQFKKWLTVQEASTYLKRSPRQVLRYIEEGWLKGYQPTFRGKWLFDIKDLDAFVMYKLPYRKLTRPQKRLVQDSK